MSILKENLLLCGNNEGRSSGAPFPLDPRLTGVIVKSSHRTSNMLEYALDKYDKAKLCSVTDLTTPGGQPNYRPSSL